METLAIIAYRQPITRPQIEAIRGVSSDGVIRSLLHRGLIEEVGRLEQPGRPVLFGTTFEFLRYFGLTSLDDLPPLAEQLVAEMARRAG
ncbi:MAG: SMC-Scp complex subunit ScpB, partial [Anaerolineae bacterium]|nr:SMC-Scp complex subunit ScpB [Anaerolineae bacterium]